MKKSAIIISVFILYTVIHCNVSVAGWLELGDNAFFDPSNIVYTKRGTILVWVKETLVLSDIYSRLVQHEVDYNKYSNYSDYSFSLELFEFDCNEQLMRLTVEYDYDKYNRVVNMTYDFESRFTVVVPGSENAFRRDELCNFAKNLKPKDFLDQRNLPLPFIYSPNIHNIPK